MHYRLQRGAGSLIIGLALSLGQVSLAAPVPWQEATFTYIADNQDLIKVLGAFTRTFGLELQMSSAVSARRDFSGFIMVEHFMSVEILKMQLDL